MSGDKDSHSRLHVSGPPFVVSNAILAAVTPVVNLRPQVLPKSPYPTSFAY